MNLSDSILIFAGGAGSGCNGPNCGRKPGKKMGNYDKPLETKENPRKNMHEMANMLLSHNFQRSATASSSQFTQGQLRENPKGKGAEILGAPSVWTKRGKQEVERDPQRMQPAGELYRFHKVIVSPAGWSHSSSFGGELRDHGRGLSADTLDKNLKEHDL